MTKADMDAARYLPVEAESVWAFQVDYANLQELAACMSLLSDYDCALQVYMQNAHTLSFAVRHPDETKSSVMHLNWIVFTGSEVIVVTNEYFGKKYKKEER